MKFNDCPHAIQQPPDSAELSLEEVGKHKEMFIFIALLVASSLFSHRISVVGQQSNGYYHIQSGRQVRPLNSRNNVPGGGPHFIEGG